MNPEKWEAGKRVIAVELDPPVDADAGGFIEGAARLRDAGADLITIADCPVGRPRADSVLLACKLKRELGIEPLPHLTCRDRNRNALRAALLGLAIEGVHNVLAVTGDPLPPEARADTKSVFDFNSRTLAAYIRDSGIQPPFHIYGALNVNSRRFDNQLKRAREKEARGVEGFLTQPVLSRTALENLKQAREALHGRILGGIFPIVSYKNACYMNAHIPGIIVGEEILSRYEGLDRAAAEELAVELSMETAADLAPYTDGLYLMTPFNRVSLMERILRGLRGEL